MADPELIAEDRFYRRATAAGAAIVLGLVIYTAYGYGHRSGHREGIATLVPDPISQARSLTIICQREDAP